MNNSIARIVADQISSTTGIEIMDAPSHLGSYIYIGKVSRIDGNRIITSEAAYLELRISRDRPDLDIEAVKKQHNLATLKTIRHGPHIVIKRPEESI